MKQLLFSICLIGMTAAVPAQDYSPSTENLEARELFRDMRFGMFIHWGAFSVLGDGEWVMNNRNIRVEEYKRLRQFFNPQQFDASKWVDLAKRAGMKYITFITRHHDGFSNWDTRQSDWKITNTPYGKDALKQLSEECHRQGMKLFCYYSLLDWSRSDYQYETGITGKGTGRTEKSNWEHYIAFMKAQLTELLTNYGKIDGIWFDGNWDQMAGEPGKPAYSKVDWHYPEIYRLIHTLQPACLVGNNHHQLPKPGEDFQLFEKDLPGENASGLGNASVSGLPLETCETMNLSWGFNINDRSYKSVKELIHYILRSAGRNANFLLNIGPMPDGNIQQEFQDTLARIGQWMSQYGDSYYGTRGDIIPPQDWGVLTQKGNSLYVHILQAGGRHYIFIPGISKKIEKAFLFKGRSMVRFKQVQEGLFLYLDNVPIDDTDTIIELD
ncbi:MAG TPA: alpha-L-fucosidase [Puia sp.]|nr:alpha-L-fucosidase [Puia sp.]